MDHITLEELHALRNTKTPQEWDATCDAIKKARGGNYPSDWWQRVMVSGLAAEAELNWKKQ